jgi:hypothetical protein
MLICLVVNEQLEKDETDAGDRSRERVVFGLFVWEDLKTRWIAYQI